jgi:CheY-like chemotaxis protein
MRVLLVEDAELLRRVIADELRDAGLDVVEASTGAEAQRAMESHAIDVLVADIRLPGFMNGWQVARYCREVEPDLPVIYVSGFHAGAAQEVPGALFIDKPYRPSQLVGLIRELTTRGNRPAEPNPGGER